MKYIAAILILTMLSCSKPANTPVTQCRSNVFAWQGKLAASSTPGDYSFGLLNTDVARLVKISASMQDRPAANQGAYNTTDHCYYIFSPAVLSSKAVLRRISLDGKIDTFTDDSASNGYGGLVFSTATGKLYCFTDRAGGVPDNGWIGEIVLSGSTFHVAKLTKTNYNLAFVTSATVDRSGTIVYAYHSPSDVAVEVWKPGDDKPADILSGTADVLGLQALQDNGSLIGLLYLPATRRYQVCRFTTSGSITPCDTVTGGFDSVLYSSCYDACSGRYIVSSAIDSTYGTVRYFDATGTLKRIDTTSGLILGMAAGSR